MGKLVLSLACIVLFTLLLSSASLGEEHNQVVERELREARDKPRGVGRAKGKKSSGGKRRNGKKRNRNVNKKKTRKQEKNKASKGRKNRKFSKKNQQKNKTPKARKSEPGCSRQTSSTFCPAEKATSMKLLYNQVYNFRKQLKRAQNHASIVKKKNNKKDNFEKDAAIITDVVGGNLTNPSCSSSRSRSSSEAASSGTTLSQCSSTIAASCEDITINSTLTGSCTTTMDTFEAKITTCKDGDSCTCWTEAFAMKSDITKCNALDEANSVKAKKKTCLSTFSDCKKAQDSAVEYTSTCPAKTNSQTTQTLTTKSTATTRSIISRRLVDTFLARNIMKRDSHKLFRV